MGETQGAWFWASLWPRLKCPKSPTARRLSLSGGDAGAGGRGLRHPRRRWYTSGVSASRRWRQEDWEVRGILGCLTSFRPSWTT